MARAADPNDLTRAPDILAAVLAAAVPAQAAAVESDAVAGSAWDDEGGR
jgi:hypothetical protein